MQPCYCPRRRRHSDSYPLVHACPATLRRVPSSSPSVLPPHPPPHWIWWRREDLPASLHDLPETPPCSSRPPLPPFSDAANKSGGAERLRGPHRNLPGYQGTWTCPRLHTPCAGPGISLYKTYSLKAASCCNSLALRVAVPVPRPALNPIICIIRWLLN